mmetsp:Transcript_19889/g.55447  ORF Transcript_19889/g.55447 Transcript_19889/m.55447 type:complete len:826 (-) Transcript_19889:1555-4032(-)
MPAARSLACGICASVGVILSSALVAIARAEWASSMSTMVNTVCICTLSLLVWLMHARATKAEAVAKRALEQEEAVKSALSSCLKQADDMANTQGKPRAERLPNPKALVHALLDMLQNGEVPPDRDLDLLRGLLNESQEVGLPLTLEEMLHERSLEPVVEDSILFTLGQKPLFPVTEHLYSNASDQGGQDSSADREAEAASYEHILGWLAQERSMFDFSGSRGKRSCRSFKRRSLLSPNPSSGSNVQQNDASNMQVQVGPLSGDVLVGISPTQVEGTLGNTITECEDTLPATHAVAANVQVPAPRMPHMQGNRGRRSIVFDSAFCGTLDNQPTAASTWVNSLGRGWSGWSASAANSPGISRRSSIEVRDDAAPGVAVEKRKSTPDGFFGLRKSRALFKSASASSRMLDARKEEEEQEQQSQQQQHDLEAEAVEHFQPSRFELCMPLMDEVDRLLAQANTSFFDTFALNDATSGHALSVLGFFLLNKSGLTSTFRISLPRLARFLRKIEAGMKAVPYHNAVHVADVLQTLHAMCSLGGLSTAIADPLYMLSAYLAAIIHDYEHEGLTNAFLIASESPLAMHYNDTAPLEQHHLSSAFSVLKEQDLMPSLPKPEFLRLRKVVIDMVLATDMAKHMDIMGRMSALAAMVSAGSMSSKLSHRLSNSGSAMVSPFSRANAQSLGPRKSNMTTQPLSPASSFTLRGESSERTSNGNNSGLLVLDEGKKVLLLQVALKCADLGHMAESFDVHSRWVSRLEEELFQQGDQEKAIGLPVSPLCDRSNPGITKSQEGFINFVVSPLFHAYTTVMPDARPMVNAIEANSRLWAERNT